MDLKAIFSNQHFLSQNIDYVFKVTKAFYSKIKTLRHAAASQTQLQDLSIFLINTVVKDILARNDEHYCKVLEFVLKIIYRINKSQANFRDVALVNLLDDIVDRFQINANLVALFIKLKALMVDCKDGDDVAKFGEIARKFAYAD